MADRDDVVENTDLENEDDLTPRTAKILSGVVVTDSDWTAETIISQLRKGNIQLNPRFQRRETWTAQRKSRFIESLIIGLPVPQLVLAELPNSKGRYLVIDGKQRLLTLYRFALDPKDPLTLTDMQYRRDLNGKTFGHILNGETLTNDLSAFENAPIRTTIVRGWTDEEVLYIIFYRLNSGSVPLSPQELRHVLHPGPFMDFAFEFAENSSALIELLGKNGKPDFRMRDVEMLIRFLGFHFFLSDYDGNLKGFLDTTAARLNESWTQQQDEVTMAAKACESAIHTTEAIFSADAFVKWTSNGPERRFNRAVFDVMAFYFANSRVAKEAIQRADAIKTAFQALCIKNTDFRRSLETTTKSVDATRARLDIWGRQLNEIVDVPNELLRKADLVGR